MGSAGQERERFASLPQSRQTFQVVRGAGVSAELRKEAQIPGGSLTHRERAWCLSCDQDAPSPSGISSHAGRRGSRGLVDSSRSSCWEAAVVEGGTDRGICHSDGVWLFPDQVPEAWRCVFPLLLHFRWQENMNNENVQEGSH